MRRCTPAGWSSRSPGAWHLRYCCLPCRPGAAGRSRGPPAAARSAAAPTKPAGAMRKGRGIRQPRSRRRGQGWPRTRRSGRSRGLLVGLEEAVFQQGRGCQRRRVTAIGRMRRERRGEPCRWRGARSAAPGRAGRLALTRCHVSAAWRARPAWARSSRRRPDAPTDAIPDRVSHADHEHSHPKSPDCSLKQHTPVSPGYQSGPQNHHLCRARFQTLLEIVVAIAAAADSDDEGQRAMDAPFAIAGRERDQEIGPSSG